MLLRAGNLLLRAHLLSRKAQDQLALERDERARDVIEKFQWVTAGTVFANPFPALELVANGAVQFQMISELAGVYGVQISTSHVRMIGGQMIQMLLKLGLVETATTLVAGIFKSSLVGYAAAGGVQAVSMAYLTHVSGEAFAEYFRSGQNWGDGGMQAALIRQFDLTSRAEFLQEFAKQAVVKVSSRLLHRFAENSRATRVQEVKRKRKASTMSDSSAKLPSALPRSPTRRSSGIGRALRDGQTTCVEILKRCFDQCDEWEPKVHAWVVLRPRSRDRAGSRARWRAESRQRPRSAAWDSHRHQGHHRRCRAAHCLRREALGEQRRRVRTRRSWPISAKPVPSSWARRSRLRTPGSIHRSRATRGTWNERRAAHRAARPPQWPAACAWELSARRPAARSLGRRRFAGWRG